MSRVHYSVTDDSDGLPTDLGAEVSPPPAVLAEVMAALDQEADEYGAELARAAGGVANFDPDQPRDAHGQWSAGGVDPDAVSAQSAPEFQRWAHAQRGGLTGAAKRHGLAIVGNPEAVERLRTHEARAHQDITDALAANRDDDALLLSSKAQFFREAREAATNTGSMARDSDVRAAHASTRANVATANISLVASLFQSQRNRSS